MTMVVFLMTKRRKCQSSVLGDGNTINLYKIYSSLFFFKLRRLLSKIFGLITNCYCSTINANRKNRDNFELC